MNTELVINRSVLSIGLLFIEKKSQVKLDPWTERFNTQRSICVFLSSYKYFHQSNHTVFVNTGRKFIPFYFVHYIKKSIYMILFAEFKRFLIIRVF